MVGTLPKNTAARRRNLAKAHAANAIRFALGPPGTKDETYQEASGRKTPRGRPRKGTRGKELRLENARKRYFELHSTPEAGMSRKADTISEGCSEISVTVDVKSMCLLCLRDCGEEPELGQFEKCDQTSFLKLLGYLKIDIVKCFQNSYASPNIAIIKFQPANATIQMENVELVVTLCDGCSSIANHLLELHQQLEMLELKLGKGMKQMCEVLQSGNTDIERLTKFRTRFCGKTFVDTGRLSILEKMRTEAMEKCSNKGNPLESETGQQQELVIGTEVFNKVKIPEKIFLKVEPTSASGSAGTELRFIDESEGDPFSTAPSDSLPGPLVLNKLTCTMCGKGLRVKNKLSNHQLASNRIQFYTCNFCGHRSSSDAKPMPTNKSSRIAPEGNLQSLQEDDKPFKCEVCGKGFSTFRGVDNHMFLLHTTFALADKLPPGTTEEELQFVLGRVSKSTCQFCKRQAFRGWTLVKSHMLTDHFTEISQILYANKGMSRIEVVIDTDCDKIDIDLETSSKQPSNLNNEVGCIDEYEGMEQKPVLMNNIMEF